MKKNICFFALISAFFAVSSIFCKPVKSEPDTKTKGKIKVVTTIFPEYDWVRNIAGDSVDLILLINKGTDMHSWQPSSSDMIKVSLADVFVYVGGESDSWVDGAVSSSVNKNQIRVNLMEILEDSVREEEVVEGMQAEQGGDEAEYDEHVWLSLRNAQKICEALTEILCAAVPSEAETFRKNSDLYQEKITRLDKEFSEEIRDSKRREILVADRFPFRYLAEDYGLKYYAAFAGCSAETEASFKTVTFLVSKMNEREIPAVLVLENSDQKLARTVVKNSKLKNQQILVLNSMQSVGAKQLAEGAGYLEIMEKNLNVLKQALN